jgi:outer membrane protein OmpA-like peptidoglycan-associated protein
MNAQRISPPLGGFLVSLVTILAFWNAIPLLGPSTAAAQELRSSLFQEADEALESAKTARADILAPDAYAEAMQLYRRAEQDLERGRDLNDIRRRLSRATELFQKAQEATELANVTLTNALGARDDAANAGAPRFAPSMWKEAEEKFRDAARELEDGDVNDAKKRGGEAEELYRDAELAAIKANYLNETWSLLDQADDQDVDDKAPKTLELAEALVKRAEQQLNESRYDTDEPRSLAREAKREAQHAIYLANWIEQFEDEDGTLEDLLLTAEAPLRRIAGSAEIPLSFEAGLEPPTDSIIARITAYQDTIQQLRSEVEGQESMVVTLEQRVDELEGQLGGIEEERSALAERLEARARLQQRFTSLERMFTREEGRVIREGDDVIIRLYGLTFPVGSATIEPRYFPILTKAQQAIKTFPDATVTIEGHTDSFGSDEANLRLSQERANAVKQYLLANMAFDASKIDAIGHGETQPVASNETDEGRAKNRRIDIVIHPGFGGG